MTERKLVAFVGLRRSGKDTAAAALVNQGWELIKFAGALKGMLRTYLTYIGTHPDITERLIEGDLKEAECQAFGGKSCRHAMQTLGTEWGRELLHNDLWVNATMFRAEGFWRSVISDCRFPNEAEAIHKAGGKIIRIEREGLSTDAHVSESGVAALPYDFSIANDSTVDSLQAKVLQLISTI